MDLFIRLIRFSAVGVLSSIIYYFVTALLVDEFKLDEKIASVYGYCAAIPSNYLLNRNFSFRSTSPIKSEIAGFLATHISGMIISYLVMAVFVDIYGFTRLTPSIFIIFIIPIFNFLILNKFVFKKRF